MAVMMSYRYLKGISIRLLVIGAVVCTHLARGAASTTTSVDEEDDGVIKTIRRKDSYGVEHIEHAFHAPSKGLPNHVIELFCASTKLRLYWNGYRDEIKQTHRKGQYLRRMARLAKHIFEEVRDVDQPFNATALSKADKLLAAKIKKSPQEEDKDKDEFDDDDDGEETTDAKSQSKMKMIKEKFTKTWANLQTRHNDESASNEMLEEIDSSETVKDLSKQGKLSAIQRIKKFVKRWSFKKVALFLYTRWRVMWWMTLSCLYTKYYLWDPALDEFTKLKRSLLMWPELQLVKLQDVQCKPVMFFRRIMDVCKILNPLMKIDFGQFNYNKLTRFKSDT